MTSYYVEGINEVEKLEVERKKLEQLDTKMKNEDMEERRYSKVNETKSWNDKGRYDIEPRTWKKGQGKFLCRAEIVKKVLVLYIFFLFLFNFCKFSNTEQ